MRYWPLSEIATSPLLPPEYVAELCRARNTGSMSNGAILACYQTATQIATVQSPLVIIESIGAPWRRVYTEYPEFEAWLALERAGFVETQDNFVFVIDALH